ncbi:MAG: Glu/Leu/Phe/Val dehydrogenase dimerization domain-containing protein [Pseudomonadota bacterium]
MSFDHPEFDGHEQIIWFHDEATGLKAITALHRQRGGAALGGIRFRAYASTDEALTDVLRLSRAMSYKWALSGLAYGGGKSVVIATAEEKTPELLRAMGDCIESLKGRYVGAPDVGSNASDMAIIRERTRHVAGLPGSDTSVPTARGLYYAIESMAQQQLSRDSVAGVHVAVQGLGGVGGRLCRHLADAGVTLTVADVNSELAGQVASDCGGQVVSPEEILAVEADVLSPCALGAVLNEQSIPGIRARLICGAANNQLATPEDAERLRAAGITWAPDYVASAGGIIGGSVELGDIDAEECEARLRGIGTTLAEVLDRAARDGINTDAAAQAMASAILSA